MNQIDIELNCDLKNQNQIMRFLTIPSPTWKALEQPCPNYSTKGWCGCRFSFQPSSSTSDLTHLINWSQSSESSLVKPCALDWLEQKPAATWPFVEQFGHACFRGCRRIWHLGWTVSVLSKHFQLLIALNHLTVKMFGKKINIIISKTHNMFISNKVFFNPN